MERRANVGARMRNGRHDTRRGILTVRRKRATGKRASRVTGAFLFAVPWPTVERKTRDPDYTGSRDRVAFCLSVYFV